MNTQQAYEWARSWYGELGVDVQAALDRMANIAISIHCWQGDDVQGFENSSQELGGGLAVTGNYPGRARSIDELRSDFEVAHALIPGTHRFNLHASYGDFGGGQVDRDAIDVEHFSSWMDWAQSIGIGLDFNPTFFSHPKADDGWTLSHQDRSIREFWIEHGRRCRRIGAAMGARLGTPCITNVWIPDGSKDQPIDRLGPRLNLEAALDAIFSEPFESTHLLDAVECKLFGIGSESYVVGSHEFYLGYAISRKTLLCLDAGHFHPTEVISDKISAIMGYLDQILLHVSRGVRWDSDHVVTLNEELMAINQEIVRGRFLDRVHIGLDFFDASINRVAAWVIGTRNVQKALLQALLEPTPMLRELEHGGDLTGRLAWQEHLKTAPFQAVWDHFCEREEVPGGISWLDRVREYEQQVLSKRH